MEQDEIIQSLDPERNTASQKKRNQKYTEKDTLRSERGLGTDSMFFGQEEKRPILNIGDLISTLNQPPFEDERMIEFPTTTIENPIKLAKVPRKMLTTFMHYRSQCAQQFRELNKHLLATSFETICISSIDNTMCKRDLRLVSLAVYHLRGK